MSDEQTIDQTTIDEDKTSLNDNDPFADLPDEEESLEEKKTDDKKIDRSEVAQKIKYREKFNKAQQRIEELERELNKKQEKGTNTSDDEKELAAQKYIRNQALEAFKEYEGQRKEEERKSLDRLQNQLDDVIEDNSDVTEAQLLDICEEFEVEPKVALKILRKTQEQKVKKPNLPQPKKGVSEAKTETKVDDAGKSLYHIAQEVKNAFKTKN